jgi:hypothetical protein
VPAPSNPALRTEDPRIEGEVLAQKIAWLKTLKKGEQLKTALTALAKASGCNPADLAKELSRVGLCPNYLPKTPLIRAR